MRQPRCAPTKPLTVRDSKMPMSSPLITVPTTRLAFSDRQMVRVVEPGDVEVWVSVATADGAASEGTAPG